MWLWLLYGQLSKYHLLREWDVVPWSAQVWVGKWHTSGVLSHSINDNLLQSTVPADTDEIWRLSGLISELFKSISASALLLLKYMLSS